VQLAQPGFSFYGPTVHGGFAGDGPHPQLTTDWDLGELRGLKTNLAHLNKASQNTGGRIII